MTPIKATIKDRRLEVDVPADWPDGIDDRKAHAADKVPTLMSPQAPCSSPQYPVLRTEYSRDLTTV